MSQDSTALSGKGFGYWLGVVMASICACLAVWDFTSGMHGWGALMVACFFLNLNTARVSLKTRRLLSTATTND